MSIGSTAYPRTLTATLCPTAKYKNSVVSESSRFTNYGVLLTTCSRQGILQNPSVQSYSDRYSIYFTTSRYGKVKKDSPIIPGKRFSVRNFREDNTMEEVFPKCFSKERRSTKVCKTLFIINTSCRVSDKDVCREQRL